MHEQETVAHLVLHPESRRHIDAYIDNPGHGLLITGMTGSGKGSIARHIVTQILQLTAENNHSYETYPYLRVVQPDEKYTIAIEPIRGLQQFLTLKIPGASSGTIARVVVIENTHLMTLQAQNALLKTLEEPPADTVLILTAPSAESVLPAVQSRLQQLAVLPPGEASLAAHFTRLGFESDSINRALTLSGQLPGLSHALLTSDTSHPLVTATTHARGILQSKTYERLLLVDGLSKQKQLCSDILFVLGQMSRMALLRATTTEAETRWRRILQASYLATEQLAHNTQTKLVLTSLMLEL